jgi:hypothetical protein
MNQTTQKKTGGRTAGLLITGASLALLFGVAFLKGRVRDKKKDTNKHQRED